MFQTWISFSLKGWEIVQFSGSCFPFLLPGLQVHVYKVWYFFLGNCCSVTFLSSKMSFNLVSTKLKVCTHQRPWIVHNFDEITHFRGGFCKQRVNFIFKISIKILLFSSHNRNEREKITIIVKFLITICLKVCLSFKALDHKKWYYVI